MTATMTCPARRHGTADARKRHRCTCPDAVEALRRRERSYRQRTYVRGRAINCGPGAPGFDEIAVDRAVAGDRTVRLNALERWAAIDRLDARGMSARQVAEQLGVTTRTVTRRRRCRRVDHDLAG